MSKYLNVPNGDYIISVQPGGTIALDTGLDIGTVEISGDLIVRGETTTINTTELSIEDRVIELNRSDTATNGIQGDGFSGLQISRGNYADAYLVFDEALGGVGFGKFVLRDQNGALIPLQTNEIFSNNTTLTLDTGSSTVSVNPTVDYEEQIFTYDGLGNLTGYNAAKADTIPNTQAVVDYVAFNFANVFLRQIGDGVLSVSSIEIDDEENTGVDSVITFKIDANTVAQVYDDRWEFEKIRISGTTIETMDTGSEDLILKSNGTGSIRIDDMLHINSVPSDDDLTLIPAFPDEGIKLYVSDQYTGKTGIFFANAQNNRDELVSKNRALLFGMLF
jgi:hypothetical protein